MKHLACVMALVACGESDADRQARYKRETEIDEATEAVCKDHKPNTRADPSKPRRLRQSIQRPDTSETWFNHDWDGLPAPKTVEELHVVACRVARDEMASSCNYERGYSIYKYKVTDTITVRDARTAQVLGEKKFEGEMPSTSCDPGVRGEPGKTHRVTGAEPNHKDETDFLKTFLLEK